MIDRELQYFQCEEGTCVGRVQPRKAKNRAPSGKLVVQSETVQKQSNTVSDFDDATEGSFSSSSLCSSSEDIDCREWREVLRTLPLDKPQ